MQIDLGRAIGASMLLASATAAMAQHRQPTAQANLGHAQRSPARSATTPSSAGNLSMQLPAQAPFARIVIAPVPDACGSLGCEVTITGSTTTGASKNITFQDLISNATPGSRAEVFGSIDANGMPYIVLAQGLIDGGTSFNLFAYKPTLRRYSFIKRVSGYAAGKIAATAADPDPTWSAFKAGSFRFTSSSQETCTVFYKNVLFSLAPHMRTNDWAGIARNLMTSGCGADIAYFLLGLAAEKQYTGSGDIGFEAAALAYYREAYRIASARDAPAYERCRTVGLVNGCSGINLPADASQPIARAQGVLGGRLVRQVDVSAAQASVSPPPSVPTVWSLGRARYLVERGQRCSAEQSLGTPYCFGQGIGWLQRHPDKQAIDVVAMESSWMLGSMIPYNNGQGWDIYRVSKNGDGYTASKQRHFGTQVRLPQGCMYSGVAENAWFITIADGRKAAVEAARYLCSGWQGSVMYTRYLNTDDLDVGPGDLSLRLATTAQSSSVAAGNDRTAYRPSTSAPTSGYDMINGAGSPSAFKQDDSGMIYGSPNDTAPAPTKKRKRK